MTATVGNIIRLMKRIAPPSLAEKWDNCGLQAGSVNWPANRIWTALDPSLPVVSAACAAGVDMLITHHPLYISPPQSLDFEKFPGNILKMAAESRLSIYSAHTNFDSVNGGLNDICASRLGLQEVRMLTTGESEAYCKLAVFIPAGHEADVLNALEQTRAGVYGEYSACSFTTPGTGRFKPSAGASPYIGQAGELTAVDEVRLETIVEKRDLADVVGVLKAAHPYETMAYDIYPLAGSINNPHGLGRIGELEKEMTLRSFAEHVRRQFAADSVRLAGDPDMAVKKVALCSGGGSGLLSEFLASPAQVYVSGDLKYHDGRTVADAGRGLVDAGHFETECLVVDAFLEMLTELARENKLDVNIEGYRKETNPFIRI